MGSSRTKKIVDQFKTNRKLFLKLKRSANKLISNFLLEQSLDVYKKSSRIKTIKSLARKLGSPSFNPSNIKKVNDVIGFRLVYILESDVKIVARELVDYLGYETAKIKYQFSENDYNAVHVIVNITNNNISGVLFEDLIGYSFEIQLTTSLYNTWSEVSHALCYKRPEMLGKYMPESLESLDDSLNSLMKNVLKDANYQLEDIYRHYNDINMTYLHFSSKEYKKAYREEVSYLALNSLDTTIKYLKKHNFKGKDSVDYRGLINKTEKKWCEELSADSTPLIHIKLVELCRYLAPLDFNYYINKMFDFRTSGNDRLTEKCDEMILQLVDYGSWGSEFGLFPQEVMIDYLATKGRTFYYQHLIVIKKIISKILKLSFDSSNMSDYRTVSFGQRYLLYSVKNSELREKALSLFERIFQKTTKENERIQLFKEVSISLRRDRDVKYGKDLKSMVKKNIETFSAIVFNETRDDQIYLVKFLYKFLSSKGISYFKCKTKLKPYMKYICDLPLFYEFDLITMSYHEIFNLEEIDKVANDRIEIVVNRMSRFSKREKANLLNCVYSFIKYDSSLNYPSILNFFERVGREFPDLLDNSILKVDGEVFISLIKGGASTQEGLESSIEANLSNVATVRPMINFIIHRKIKINKYLKEIVKVHHKNIYVLNEVADRMLWNKLNSKEQRNIFIEVVKRLTELNSSTWPNLYFSNDNGFLDRFNSKQLELITSNLVYYINGGYHLGAILKDLFSINEKYPRLYFSRNFKLNPSQYIDTYELKSSLGGVLDAEFSYWALEQAFGSKNYEEEHYYKNLLKLSSPSFDKTIEDYLDEYINKDIDKVFDLLQGYSGSVVIHSYIKKLIILLDSDNRLNEYKGDLFHLLEFSSGIVTGEFGFVDRLKSVKESVSSWSDQDKVVIKFKNDFIKSLDNRINIDTSNVTQRVQLEKLEFNRNKS